MIKEKDRKVITCRPKEKNRKKLFKMLDKETVNINSPSISHTIETILLTYFASK